MLPSDHGDVPDGDVVGRHDDSPADDGARLADELLRVVEDERPLVDARGEMDDGRLRGPCDRPAAARTTSAVAATPTPARPSSPPSSP